MSCKNKLLASSSQEIERIFPSIDSWIIEVEEKPERLTRTFFTLCFFIVFCPFIVSDSDGMNDIKRNWHLLPGTFRICNPVFGEWEFWKPYWTSGGNWWFF